VNTLDEERVPLRLAVYRFYQRLRDFPAGEAGEQHRDGIPGEAFDVQPLCEPLARELLDRPRQRRRHIGL
jgi:hypothetical protein